VQPILQARGDDADHAFVEARGSKIGERRRRLAFGHQHLEQRFRLLAHARSTSRRSRLIVSSVFGQLVGARTSSVSRHSMPASCPRSGRPR
jgi:hypothetical protein